MDKYKKVIAVGIINPFRYESGCFPSKKGNGRSKKYAQ